MDNKIYALMGAQASGKATMAAHLKQMGIHFIPVYTTQDFSAQKHNRHYVKRDDMYITVSREEFTQMEFIIEFSHKGESYGYKKDDILDSLRDHHISVMILEVTGLKLMTKLIKKKLATIFLMVDYVTLVDRLLQLGYNNDEIKYHLQYAENNKEFNLWKICSHIVRNTCEKETALIQILAIMGLTMPVPQEQFDKMIE
ncbi:guanylate kinase [Selenomonas ruminantium]|uniref:Guanylate kinase n=1 Tax=Selenomonas ruminantium TaxID=971 RepID=A0A1M6S397_SELRU|nr:AAA family ATPase [Selenomonas ruminantium]SHK39150.1 guanylate kinase [Selenomonas ruminantium]